MIVTRFAPSPTGHLHPGHAYSALYAFNAAQKAGGRFLVRIEDIDPTRCKPEFTKDILEDLGWLRLRWPEPVRMQSQHPDDYKQALDVLKRRKLVYPCFCTRREIMDENARAGYAQTPNGPIYPGICRHFKDNEVRQRLDSGMSHSWRFDVERALQETGVLSWHDRRQGKIDVRSDILGDVVLARKDMPTSYHLSVTVDDHLQGVTLVTRGEDLFSATHIHRLLQAVLGYQTPDYDHHRLICDANGKRFAKRDKSVTLRALRNSGKTADDIYTMVGLSPV